MTVTLRDIVLAVRYGDAALAGESAGYLVLGATDLALRSAQFATVDSVSVSPEGSVELRGTPCCEDDAEDSLRLLLGQLLENVRGSFLNLERISTRAERRGLAGLVQELEAALIPVNRRAGARTHARLVREASRSAAQERAFAKVEPVPRPSTETVSLEMSPFPVDLETPESNALVSLPQAVHPPTEQTSSSTDHPVDLTMDARRLPSRAQSGEPRRTLADLDSPGRRMNPRDVVVSSRELPPSKTSHLHTNGASRPLVLASLAQSYAASAVSTPVPQATRPEFEETASFVDDELDETPTTVFEGRIEHLHPQEGVESSAALTPRVAPAVITTPVEPPAPLPMPRIVIGPAPLPVPENLAQARLARRVPPKIRFLHAVRRRREPISAEVSLVPHDQRAPQRRPSDIAQLLDRIKIEGGSPDELYAGLQSLARIDHSPLAPAVEEATRPDAS